MSRQPDPVMMGDAPPAAAAGARRREPRSVERRVWSGDDITPERLARALEILQASFQRWPRFEVPVAPIEHLRWKLEHPGWAPSSLVGEVVDGVIAGVTLRLHRGFEVGGAPRQARDWVDQCLDPAYQETGIYSRLASTWKEQRGEYDFGVWSTSHPKVVRATRASEPSYIELGDRIRAWLLPLGSAGALAARGDSALPAWRRAVLSRAAIAASRLRRAVAFTAPSRRPCRDPAVRAVERFDQSLVPMIEAAAGGFDFVQERTPAFLNWRYRDPRGGRYTVLAAEDGAEVVGFAALKISDGIGYVMDLVTYPASNAADALLETAIDRLGKAGVEAVGCRLPRGHPLSGVLARHGFVDVRLRTGYAVSSGRQPLAALRFLAARGARLHLMLGDMDWC